MSEKNPGRFSDEELEEFRVLIEKKLAKAEVERVRMQERLQELEEQADSDRGDYIDDSSYAYDVEQLNSLEFRQRKHVQDLKNALLRIKSRTYGVCTITGQLIDKRRLMAVPTTTKSLEGKEMVASGKNIPMSSMQDEDGEKKKERPTEKKVITRIIKKTGTTPKPAQFVDPDLDDDLLGGLDPDDIEPDDDDTDDIDDLDNLVHPDYDDGDDD